MRQRVDPGGDHRFTRWRVAIDTSAQQKREAR
jgi:hypothetical protein